MTIIDQWRFMIEISEEFIKQGIMMKMSIMMELMEKKMKIKKILKYLKDYKRHFKI